MLKKESKKLWGKFKKLDIFECMFYFFKAWGLAPMSFSINYLNINRREKMLFTHSYLGNLYNCSIIAFIILLSYFSFAKVISSHEVKYDEELYFIADNCMIFSIAVILIMYCLQQNKAIAALTRMNIIKDMLLEEDMNNKYGRFIQKMSFLIFINVLSGLGIVFITKLPDKLDQTLLCSVSVYCHSIMNVMILQYSIGIRSIACLFKVINKILLKMSSQSKFHCTATAANISSEAATKLEVNKLMHLRELFSHLSKLSEDFSNLYSCAILLSMLNKFSTLATNVYFIVKPIFIEKAHWENMYFITRFLIAFSYIFPFVTLSRSVTTTVYESKRTGSIIHDYIGNSEKEQVKNSLRDFSTYLLHEDIKFTVYDLFSLDNTVLVWITGSIATYLVILLEFSVYDAVP